ncbi:hypothetical protein BLNAU_7394 [Blattamonas nauphoetae]|uniref:Uncharacterized protein n=1 Tax=Blattamonas nauphoetae TaxID=2049346 RepID=A0ABQ9Y183_9EUKA|nr:hypothetical protein BLNAU_7394 [Blattamonas nauphoetae]
MIAFDTTINTSPDSPCPDCSQFLDWDEETLETEQEIAEIFMSLVATVKLQPSIDDSLEAKALNLLSYVLPHDRESADAFLDAFGPTTDESSTNFVRSIVVLLSSSNQAITTATMKMIKSFGRF